MPFPGNLKPEEVTGMAILRDERGRPLPRFFSNVFSDMPYLPSLPIVQTLAVDDQGRLRMAVGSFRWEGGKYGVATVGPDGSMRGAAFCSNFVYPAPLGAFNNDMELGLALSETVPGTALLAGMKKAKDKKDPSLHAVFRVPLEGEGKMEPVFGEPETAGADEKHLK